MLEPSGFLSISKHSVDFSELWKFNQLKISILCSITSSVKYCIYAIVPCYATPSTGTYLRLKSPASRLFTQPSSKKTSKLRVIGLCVGNSPVIGEFPAQMASKAENVSIWWRHHGKSTILCLKRTKTCFVRLLQAISVFPPGEEQLLNTIIDKTLPYWSSEFCEIVF